jgi:hypothetical protein
MGGVGSGGHGRVNLGTTGDCRALTVGRLYRAGVLGGGWHGTWQWTHEGERAAWITIDGGRNRILLRYQVRSGTDEWRAVERPVGILWRPCRFGGERPYFSCPGCHRAVLQLFAVAAYFACRHCARLTYPSCRENEEGRTLRRAMKLRKRLGAEAENHAELPERPKYMHKRTYERIIAEIRERERTADDYAGMVMMRFVRRLERRGRRSFWS